MVNGAIDLSVVIPCYNEERNIPILLRNFSRILASRNQIELILVDNGSQDQTGKMIEQEIAQKGYAFARKVAVQGNRGYGFGILSGLKQARGTILAWTHADLQTDPEDVLRAYQLYLEKSKGSKKILVKGHRKNRDLLEKLLSLGMQLLTNIVLGAWLDEINAQPKLFPRTLLEKMTDPPEDFSLDLYLLYLAKREKYEIVSLPVYFKERIYGEAKGGGGGFKIRWNLIQRTLHYIFALKGKVAQNSLA